MKTGKQIVKKIKKAILGAAAGTLISAVVAIILFALTGQVLYLAIVGLGAGIGYSIGSEFDHRLDVE